MMMMILQDRKNNYIILKILLNVQYIIILFLNSFQMTNVLIRIYFLFIKK